MEEGTMGGNKRLEYVKKKKKKKKKQDESMKKKRKKEKPIQVFGHPQCFVKPAYVLGTDFDLYPCRCGFCGYGCGLDFADPCHTHVPP